MFNFRYLIFKVSDFLNGNRIHLHLQNIHKLVINPFSENSIRIRQKKLNKILNHAHINVPFYQKKKYSKLGEIKSFPVINKNIVRDQIDEFISIGVNKDALIKVVTSGSTGTPFSVYHDSYKQYRNKCDTIYFGNLSGFTIGTKLYYLKIWNQINRKSKFTIWKQNIKDIDVTQLSDKNIEQLINEIAHDLGPKAFLGYASALETIACFASVKFPELSLNNVTSIIAMSESLNLNAKNKIKNVFGQVPVSRYSNVENGIIAQQLPDGSNEFVINWASYYIEILDFDVDIPAEMGTLGRIVVTDLYNYSMPMIRYDTGDIGSFIWSKDKRRIMLNKVEGRRMDQVFNTDGELVSSFTITNNMWLYPEIKQYQFIQLSKNRYLFKLNLNKKFDREKVLISEFQNHLGSDAKIEIEYVNEIPLLNSGKRKKVMNISGKNV